MAGRPGAKGPTSWRPTAAQIAAATDKRLMDLLGPGLRLVFCGINPGLYSAAVGHHFARPGNRFWPTIFAAGFTPHLFSPFEDERMLELGYGMTNIVPRATAAADELSREELRQGARALVEKLERYRPAYVAFLGVGSYRWAFEKPKAALGLQAERLGASQVWVLPSPSGLNAHYTPETLLPLYRALRNAVAAVPVQRA